jgi:hypothetical protein
MQNQIPGYLTGLGCLVSQCLRATKSIQWSIRCFCSGSWLHLDSTIRPCSGAGEASLFDPNPALLSHYQTRDMRNAGMYGCKHVVRYYSRSRWLEPGAGGRSLRKCTVRRSLLPGANHRADSEEQCAGRHDCDPCCLMILWVCLYNSTSTPGEPASWRVRGSLHDDSVRRFTSGRHHTPQTPETQSSFDSAASGTRSTPGEHAPRNQYRVPVLAAFVLSETSVLACPIADVVSSREEAEAYAFSPRWLNRNAMPPSAAQIGIR